MAEGSPGEELVFYRQGIPDGTIHPTGDWEVISSHQLSEIGDTALRGALEDQLNDIRTEAPSRVYPVASKDGVLRHAWRIYRKPLFED